ncbi:Zn-binding ribosomal protein, partial [Achaetomium macrosporum]
LRKQARRSEASQHARYTFTFCGQELVKHLSVGVWQCRRCKKTIAGDAYLLS